MCGEWQPIASVPDDVREALLCWPALLLDADDNLTDQIAGLPLVGRATRISAKHGWDSNEPELEANGAYFGDAWESSHPTHWMRLPAPPAA
jgi:hypothetical protein